MSHDHYINEDRPDESDWEMKECIEWHEQQMALPVHKRDGYAERIYESADDHRKELRENAA